MSEHDINRICLAVKRGARVMIGSDALGRKKIKVVKGPFGLFAERFQCTEVDIAAINKRLQPIAESAPKTPAAA